MTQPITDSTQSGAEDQTQSGGPEDVDGATGTTTDTGATTDSQSAGRVYTEAEYAAMRERMRGADQAKARAEAALAQLRDKDLPEHEKLKRDFDTATQNLAKAEQALRETRIENAFYRNTKHEWNNPGAAMKLLDYSKIEILDDGTVSGLDDAVEALAKSDPYLLKPKVEGKDGTAEVKGGTIPGTNGGQKASPSASQMVARFPAMGSRIRKSN